MKPRTAACFLAGLTVGVGLCLAARRVLSPFQALPADAIHVYVVSGCGGSRLAVEEFSGPELSQKIWVVPLEGYAVPFGRDVCRPVLERLTARRPLLGRLPEALACDWLAADAAAEFGDVGHATVITRGPEILEGTPRTAEVFKAAGLSYAPTRGSFGVRPL